MLLDERHATKYVNQKRYPFILGGVLCALTLLAITLVCALGRKDLAVSMAGIEILLYLILNCVSGLIVTHIKPYFRSTIITFLVNLIVVAGYIYLLLGSDLADYREYSPILEAFLFSFFGSFILVVLIRTVISFLKE